jgi:hypothetical protein
MPLQRCVWGWKILGSVQLGQFFVCALDTVGGGGGGPGAPSEMALWPATLRSRLAAAGLLAGGLSVAALWRCGDLLVSICDLSCCWFCPWVLAFRHIFNCFVEFGVAPPGCRILVWWARRLLARQAMPLSRSAARPIGSWCCFSAASSNSTTIMKQHFAACRSCACRTRNCWRSTRRL